MDIVARESAVIEGSTEKEHLRERFKSMRDAIPQDVRCVVDEAIEQTVATLPEFAIADAVFTYLSFGAEVDTRMLIELTWGAGKTVALPRCVAGACALGWYAMDILADLERSSLGMEEPPADPDREVGPHGFRTPLAIVPGLAFDREGFRLGYGGGFYDAFLPSFPGMSVGLCRTAQLVDRLPVRDAHDVPVDLIVTEHGVIRPQ